MQSSELWSIIFYGQKLIEWLWTITVQMSKIRLNTGGLLRQQTKIIAVTGAPSPIFSEGKVRLYTGYEQVEVIIRSANYFVQS